MLDEEIGAIVRNAIRSTFGENVVRDDARMDLELLDLAIDGCGDWICSRRSWVNVMFA